MTLDDLKAICAAATPGPWWYDSGNGEVESRAEGYYRAVVCNRTEHFQYHPHTGDSVDPRYEMCPDATRINPECDPEFIATFNPATVLKLLAAVDTLHRIADGKAGEGPVKAARVALAALDEAVK